jgi:hypothetical protein
VLTDESARAGYQFDFSFEVDSTSKWGWDDFRRAGGIPSGDLVSSPDSCKLKP